LRFSSKTKPVCKTANIVSVGNGQYEMAVQAGTEYVITYKAS
jgi:alpha-L-rhamnosidase